ncbi:MAG: SulP family inorganic anion transporter [Planctomycetota bacterium]
MSDTPTPTPPPAEAQARGGFMNEFSASLVVFLVAVPLCLGIALASNAPVMSGLIAGIIGGIVVGAMSGAPLQVSGPAAGLVVLVFGLTEQMNGDWRMVCAVIALAGVLQILFAALRIARYSLAVSPAVVHGMLSGIGVLIALGQLHVVLGGRPQSSALANLRDLPAQLANPNFVSIGIGLIALALLIAWPKLKIESLRKVPAPLVAVVIATLASLALADGALERISLVADDHVHAVSAAGEVLPDGPKAPHGDGGHLLSAISLPVWPSHLGWLEILQGAFALALIASVESLLCAVATDKLHGGEPAKLDRELFAQGVGNTVSGLVGGLPITGVIVRSSANIGAGAKTRWSAVLHGVWILIFVGALPFVVEAIPKTVLAALLVLIGVRLLNVGQAKHLHKHGELPLFLITVGGVVFINLLAGVAIGFACALLRLLWSLGKVDIKVEGEVVEVRGALSFLAVPKLTDALRKLTPKRSVRVDLKVDSMDHAGWAALDAWRDGYEASGGKVDLVLPECHWAHELLPDPPAEEAPDAPQPALAGAE